MFLILYDAEVKMEKVKELAILEISMIFILSIIYMNFNLF